MGDEPKLTSVDLCKDRALPEPLRIELISENDIKIVAGGIRADMRDALIAFVEEKLGMRV